jgi:hypothetical protein
MVMCRAIGLEWMVAHSVLNTISGLGEERDEQLEEMREEYDRLSAQSAGRLLGYWQVTQARQQTAH